MTRIKRLTIDDLLPSDRSDNFVIDQDKKTGNPRVIRKRKEISSNVCGCGKGQICVHCFEENKSENNIKKEIIDYASSLPYCLVTEVETTGRKKGRGWVPAKESEGVGRGDLFICYYGRYIEVETKKKKGKRRKEQIERTPKVNAGQGEHWFTETLEEFIEEIRKFNLKINQ